MSLQASACNTDVTPTQPHRNSNTHRTKNNKTNVVIQKNSCKLLMMDILMSEICWAHKKWNKIASDIKLVFYSSTNKTYVYQVRKHLQGAGLLATSACYFSPTSNPNFKQPLFHNIHNKLSLSISQQQIYNRLCSISVRNSPLTWSSETSPKVIYHIISHHIIYHITYLCSSSHQLSVAMDFYQT